MEHRLLTIELRLEHDVVHARQRARQISGALGFLPQEQTRISTAVSELCRNAFSYAGGGRVEFAVRDGAVPELLVRVDDNGPGIQQLDAIMEGRYRSPTGLGIGLLGTKRLVDSFDVQSVAGKGTSIRLGKLFTKGMPSVSPELLRKVANELAQVTDRDPLSEIQRQNQELLVTLEELRTNQAELLHVNSELEDTNRGVVALLAELDEKADLLRRASEMKSRFLSNMSHEFRTPVNTILSFTDLLISRADGPLNGEQEKQVAFIRKAAIGLSELVNDVLDIAKVEAGKMVVRPADIEVSALFSALRGMLRTLLVTQSVQLVFEDPSLPLAMHQDESKLSQILRNFVSNGLKFTDRGEVRVTARQDGSNVVFAVRDTGVGIAPEDQEKIFEEFVQVESARQKSVKGTGLGLPLSRKLAELLGGRVWVESEPGVGSTFYAQVPLRYAESGDHALHSGLHKPLAPGRKPVLIVEDNPETLLTYEKYLSDTQFQAIAAHTVLEAREILKTLHPAGIVLDVLVGHDSTWALLSELKSQTATKDIPTLVVTVIDNAPKAYSLGADGYATKPISRAWLLANLDQSPTSGPTKVLVIDDDEAARYYARSLLLDTEYAVVDASGGQEGLSIARRLHPAVILLDLNMPDMNGYAVLDQMSEDPSLRSIPVIVQTASWLDDDRRKALERRAVAILTKENPSRDDAQRSLTAALARACSQTVQAGSAPP